MCSCPAHRDLVDCVCECDHTNDRLAQWEARTRQAEAEIARLRTGESDDPGAPHTEPSPAQWIHRWNDATADRRLTIANLIIEQSARAAHCFMADHEGRIEDAEDHLRRLREAQLEVSRLREKVAWADFTAARGWWNWPLVQWWWYRQYKRRDRKAFRRETAEIQDRAARGDQ